MPQVTGTREWIDSARNAARALRAVMKPPAKRTPEPEEFPETPYVQSGLRNLEQTMSMEAEEGKGRIINRYL